MTGLARKPVQMAVIWAKYDHKVFLFVSRHTHSFDFAWTSLRALLSFSKSTIMTGTCVLQNVLQCIRYISEAALIVHLQWLRHLGCEHIHTLTVLHKSTSETNILFEWVESLMKGLNHEHLPFIATEWSEKHPSDPHEPLSLQDQCVCVSNWIRVFYSISPFW